MFSKLLMMFGLLAFSGLASAAINASVTTALTDAATDVGTVGGAVLAILVVVAAFRYIRKAF